VIGNFYLFLISINSIACTRFEVDTKLLPLQQQAVQEHLGSYTARAN